MSSTNPRDTAMRTLALAIAFVALTGLVVWLLLSEGAGDDWKSPSKSQQTETNAEAVITDPQAAATTGAPETEERLIRSEADPAREETNPDQPARDFIATGRVLTQDDQPVVGVDVMLKWEFELGMSAVSEGPTDAHGEFLAIPLDGASPSGKIDGAAVLHPDWVVTAVQVDSGTPDCTIRVRPADAWLPIRLIDEQTRAAIADMRVTLSGPEWSTSGISDADGRLRLAGTADMPVSLRSLDSSGDWLRAPDPLILQAGMNAELEVEVRRRPDKLHLIAVDDRNGARLESTQWIALDDGVKTLLHAGSEFQWDAAVHPRFDGNAILLLEAEGYLASEYSTWNVPKLQPVELRLARASVLELAFIFTKQEQPVVDELFSINPQRRFRAGAHHNRYPPARTRSDGNGRAIFELVWPEGGLFPRELSLHHGHQSYHFLTERLGPQPWHIELEPAQGTLEFRFVDEQGQAILGRSVSVRLDVGEEGPKIYSAQSSWTWFHSTPSDERGIARVDIPAQIAFAWATSKEGIGDLGKAVSGEALEPGELRLIDVLDGTTGDIAGRLVFPEGWSGNNQIIQLELLDAEGQPILDEAGVAPAWASASAGGHGFGFGSEIDTSFRFGRVPRGEYRLRYIGANIENGGIAVQTGQEDLLVEMPMPGTVALEFVDADSGRLVDTRGFVRPSVGWLSQVEGGRSIVRVLPGESIHLISYLDGYLDQRIEIGKVAGAGERIERTIKLQAGRKLVIQSADPEVRMELYASYWNYLLADGSLAMPPSVQFPAPSESSILLQHFPLSAFTLVRTDKANNIVFSTEVPAGTGRTTVTVDYP